MLPDTPSNRWLMRIVILVFRSWGHLCLSYTLVNLWQFWPHLAENLTVWRAYCAAEAVFLLFFVYYRWRLQHPAVHPPSRSSEERKALFEKVYAEIHDPVSFLRGWFKGAEIRDIGLRDLQEFLIWSFWDGRNEEVDEDELQEYVEKIQQLAPELSFGEGSGNARGLRLTMDNFEIDYRTLFWYGIIMMLDIVAFVAFYSRGYTYHHTPVTSMSIFPPRLGAFVSPNISKAKNLSYWCTRPHTSTTRLPILYFHGIGIGLVTYCQWIHVLDRALNAGRPAHDQVGIILIEIPQISSRITMKSIPQRQALIDDFTTILDKHDFKRFVLSGHSYGSVMSTHVLRSPTLSKRVASVLLIDPVAIMLHMPDVAYNFTVRPPRGANEWQLWFFASKDPGVAHTLGRNFFWYENVLWRDVIHDLVTRQGVNFTVSLGSDDLIVNAPAVGRYLMNGLVPDPVIERDVERGSVGGGGSMKLESHGSGLQEDAWKTKKWTGTGLEIMWWPGYDHATVYSRQASSEELIRVLVEYSRKA